MKSTGVQPQKSSMSNSRSAREKQVILFAPTYRGKGRGDAAYPYELIDFEKLYQLCGEDTVVLFKMHPWVRQPYRFLKAAETVFSM